MFRFRTMNHRWSRSLPSTPLSFHFLDWHFIRKFGRQFWFICYLIFDDLVILHMHLPTHAIACFCCFLACVLTWRFCTHRRRVIVPLRYISENKWCMVFLWDQIGSSKGMSSEDICVAASCAYSHLLLLSMAIPTTVVPLRKPYKAPWRFLCIIFQVLQIYKFFCLNKKLCYTFKRSAFSFLIDFRW